MKKIIVVMDSLYNGGAEKSLVNFLNALPSDKYQVDLLLLRRMGMFMAQVPDYVNFLETPPETKKLFGKVDKAGNFVFRKVIGTLMSRNKSDNPRLNDYYRWRNYYSPAIPALETEYDVALSYTSGCVMYYTLEKIKAKKKYTWLHSDFIGFRYPVEVYREYYKEYDGIVSISDKCVDTLKSIFPEYEKKIFLLENITSSELLRKRSAEFIPEEYQKDVCNIVSIGRLEEEKGFDLAIDAAKCLKDEGMKFKWFLIGSGGLEQDLKKRISDNRLQSEFIMLGSKENPYPYIKNASMLVQPSRFEGKSVVLDEAKILGTPIVVTNYSTVADQIAVDKEGIITDMTPSGIAEGIKKMCDNSYRQSIENYISTHEYGNQKEVLKYIDLIEK